MNSKKVEQYDLDDNFIKTHDSYAAAAKELGVDESTIRKAAKFGKTVKGLYWFIDEESSEEVNEIQINTKYEFDNPVKFSSEPIVIKTGPKILIVDIETSPLRAFTWGLWKQNVNLSQIISNWYMLGWACKYLGEDKIYSGILKSEEALYENDERIVRELWEHLDNADIVIAHNGDKFDIPKINTRFLLHGLIPPSPYKQIDTLTVARQQFSFSSNRLDYLAEMFNIPKKLPTNFELWSECMVGNPEALKYMNEYNIADIVLLEEVYLRIRPYIKSHPNLDLYKDSAEATCPICGSTHLEEVSDKYFFTQAVRYKVYRCDDCGGLSRSKTGVKYFHKKQLSAIPK